MNSGDVAGGVATMSSVARYRRVVVRQRGRTFARLPGSRMTHGGLASMLETGGHSVPTRDALELAVLRLRMMPPPPPTTFAKQPSTGEPANQIERVGRLQPYAVGIALRASVRHGLTIATSDGLRFHRTKKPRRRSNRLRIVSKRTSKLLASSSRTATSFKSTASVMASS